jgi:hypothetical protein
LSKSWSPPLITMVILPRKATFIMASGYHGSQQPTIYHGIACVWDDEDPCLKATAI